MGAVKGYKKLASSRVGFDVLLNYFPKPGGFSIGGDYSARNGRICWPFRPKPGSKVVAGMLTLNYMK